MNVNIRRFWFFIKRHHSKALIWKVLSYLMRMKMGNDSCMIMIKILFRYYGCRNPKSRKLNNAKLQNADL